MGRVRDERLKKLFLTATLISNPTMSKTLEVIARAMGRQLDTLDDVVKLVWELWTRRVIVDEGSGGPGKRQFSVRFERLGKGIQIPVEAYWECA